MTFAILAPDLSASDARLLRVALSHCRLPWVEPVARLEDATSRLVLSVGKAGLDVWHEFGLVHVGANHGETFRHRARDGRVYTIMMLLHPGAMQQLSITRHSAREDMVRDLTRWGDVVEGARAGRVIGYGPTMCGGCQKARPRAGGAKRVLPGVHEVAELDSVVLCEDHYRKRAQYKAKKKPRVKERDRGKSEHQIPGQGEMLPGDGTEARVVVAKGRDV